MAEFTYMQHCSIAASSSQLARIPLASHCINPHETMRRWAATVSLCDSVSCFYSSIGCLLTVGKQFFFFCNFSSEMPAALPVCCQTLSCYLRVARSHCIRQSESARGSCGICVIECLMQLFSILSSFTDASRNLYIAVSAHGVIYSIAQWQVRRNQRSNARSNRRFITHQYIIAFFLLFIFGFSLRCLIWKI